jgi:hypothetical protein
MELTIEQQKELALASARKRLVEAGASAVGNTRQGQQLADGGPATAAGPSPTFLGQPLTFQGKPIPANWLADPENMKQLMAPYSLANQPSLSEVLDAFQTGAHNGMTWGFGDEIQAGLETPFRTAGQAINGDLVDLGKAYGAGLEETRAHMDERTSKAPAAAFVGELVGGLVSGSTLAKGTEMALKAGVPLLEAIMRGGIEGGIYGGISGFGNSRSEDLLGRLGDAYMGALWGVGTGAAMTGGGAVASGAGKRLPVQTVEELNAAALAKYAQAGAAGVKASKPQTATLATSISDIATSNGLVSRSGKLDTSNLRILNLIKSFDEFAGRKMNVPQMLALRVKLTDMAKSSEPAERRIAMQMLEEFDRFTDELAPTLKAGNALSHSATKGDLIESAIERARVNARGRTGSEFEKALRTEFETLQHQIIKGELKGLTATEIDAINKVADGTPLANALRGIGQLAPPGAVPTMALGMVAQEPKLGGLAALALGTAGVGSRVAANTLTKNAAESAALIARNGGVAVPRKQLTAEELALIAWLRRGASLEAGQLPLEVP